MKITAKQNKLLLKASSNLKQLNQEFVVNMLIQLAESDNWFHKALLFTLKKGLTFVYSTPTLNPNQHTDKILPDNRPMHYDVPSNSIKIHPSLFSESAIRDILPTILTIFFRHEVTHAVDLIRKSGNKKQFSTLIINLTNYAKLASTLYNQLSCILQRHRVNSKALTQIASLLYPYVNTTGLVTYDFNTNLEFENTGISRNYLITLSMENLGSYIEPEKPLANNRFVTRTWPSNNAITYHEFTYDLVFVKSLFDRTRMIRVANKVAYLENHFHANIDPQQLALYQTLSEQQRRTLSMLFGIRTRMQANVAHDAVCWPQLERCITTETYDCFNSFIACQRLTDPTNSMALSAFETHAVWHELAFADKITPTMLKELCEEPTQSTTQYTAKIDERSSEASQEVSISHSALYSGLNSAGFSCVSELIETYATQNKLPVPALLIKIAYITAIGSYNYYNDPTSTSFLFQVVIPALFTILHKALGSMNYSAIAKNSLVAATFTAQTMVSGLSNTVACFMAGVAGSSMGVMLGQSISHCFGWRKSQTETVHRALIKAIQPLVADQDDKFKPFVSAINEKKYTTALRRACTSTHPTAIKLLEILLAHKQQLKLTIDEQAGDKIQAAIHIAAVKNNRHAYDLLVTHGANVHTLDNSNTSAAEYMLKHSQGISSARYRN